MDRTDASTFIFGLVVYVVGVVVGGATIHEITTNSWTAWATENDHAHYDQKTGELVLHEKEVVE